MKIKIPLAVKRYFLAMNASAFDAAVHSSVAFLGVAGAHAALDAIPALNLPQFAAVFLITFGRAILAYLDAHPIEPLLPADVTNAVTFGLPPSGGSAPLFPPTTKTVLGEQTVTPLGEVNQSLVTSTSTK
jgi:hypothetical protein